MANDKDYVHKAEMWRSETKTKPRLLTLSLRRDRDETIDLPTIFRDREEIETFDFGSEAETETKTEIFFETFHTSRPNYFFKATTTMASSIHALIFNNWNKHQKSSWHYQEFTQPTTISIIKHDNCN